MKEDQGKYDVHVFVCTNEKKSGSSCGPHGAEEIRKQLKDWAKENPDWKKRIRINTCGCLDRCNEGVAVAIYPQNRWFVNVRKKSLDELKSEIEKLMKEADEQREKEGEDRPAIQVPH